MKRSKLKELEKKIKYIESKFENLCDELLILKLRSNGLKEYEYFYPGPFSAEIDSITRINLQKKGFNYVHTVSGGYEVWMKDCTPDD